MNDKKQIEEKAYYIRAYDKLRAENKAFKKQLDQARKQAVKEFAELIKSKMSEREYMGVKYKQGVFSDNEIDELAKELGVEV